MKKRIYRGQDVKALSSEWLLSQCSGRRLILGWDVAKEWQFGALMTHDREVLVTIRWRHPEETRVVVGLLKSLPSSELEVSMESSGTYGDSLRERFQEAGIAVYRVSTKRMKDAHEVYDGVPSRHDAKCAAVLAWLHLEGKSEPWKALSSDRRDLRALMSGLDLYESQYRCHLNRLEALLARHWPEATSILDLGRASLLELLMEYGGPGRVGEDLEGAGVLLRRVGGVFLKEEKVDRLLESALGTVGVVMQRSEEALLSRVATEVRRAQHESRAQHQAIAEAVASDPSLKTSRKLLGSATTAVVVCLLGKPSEYRSASSYVKAAGLNLTVVSSGKRQGTLRLSKRGSGPLRRWLFLAALRLIQRDSVVKAWYEKKVARDGGVRMKGVAAVMRKLVKALWHVGQGKQFDSRLLFDVSRLNLAI